MTEFDVKKRCEQIYSDTLKYYSSSLIGAEVLTQWSIAQEDWENIYREIVKTSPEHILEIGTFVGFSTFLMAAASSPSCTIDTIDPNLPVQQEVSAVDSGFSNISHARTLDIAGIVYEKYLKQHRVNFLEGCLNFDKSYSTNNAKLKKWLPELLQQGRRYDLIFIDGLHNEHAVLSDLIASSQLLAANGCILLHDARFRWAEEILYGVVKFFEINTDFTAHRYEAGSVMKLTRRT